MKSLLLFSDILCVQEHFLLDSKNKKHSNTNKLVSVLGSSHDMHIVPAHKDNNQVSRGRGKGGLVTLWRKELTKYVSKIDCSNYRIQATKFNFSGNSLALINAYFPCDPKVENFDESDLLNLLADIRAAIESADCLNVILAGDLNSDFARSTRFTEIVEENLNDLDLTIFWQNFNDRIHSIDYTHCCETNNLY